MKNGRAAGIPEACMSDTGELFAPGGNGSAGAAAPPEAGFHGEKYRTSGGAVIDKVAHYGWTIKDKPGRFAWIDKHALTVDPAYQRGEQTGKIKRISSRWSWVGCAAIVVAEREGHLFVVDGQQRVLAARRRSDVDMLPCLVFESTGQAQEAEGFLNANAERKPVTSVAKYRARLTAQDPAALALDALLRDSGHEVAETTAGPKTVKCVGAILTWIEVDPGLVRRVWPLVTEVCAGGPVSERLFLALTFIERHATLGESLLREPWRGRVLRIGRRGLLDACARAGSFYARGGTSVWADGIVEALNRGVRKRLILDVPRPGNKEVAPSAE